MRLRNRRSRLAATAVAALAVLAFVSGAWAFISGGTAPVTFSIRLDGELIATAKSYELKGATVTEKKDSYKQYTLRLTLRLTDNPAPVEAFQTGQTFASAKVELIGVAAAVLKTYELSNATVVAYRQSGDAATNFLDQDLVLTSHTLTVSGP